MRTRLLPGGTRGPSVARQSGEWMHAEWVGFSGGDRRRDLAGDHRDHAAGAGWQPTRRPTAFSATRAMADVRVVGRAPHVTGSVEDAQVRAHLIARLQSMGLAVATTEAAMSPAAAKRLSDWSKSTVTPPLTNIVAILPGRDRTLPAVLLMAHHDSVWGSPGAADDGAGVASILETVRAIRASGQPPQRDLMVLLTDGEELGLEGAKAFFASDPRRGHVGVIVNLETRGGGGRASMFETGSDNGAMMTLFGQSVSRPVGTSLSVFIYKKLPNSTDYTVAKKLGVPGFNFAFIGRPGLYHSPLATPEALDQGALQDMGRQVLDLTRGLLAAPALPGKAPDRVFFDAFGLFFVSYSTACGWLILALGAAGYAVAAWRRATRERGCEGGGGAARVGRRRRRRACISSIWCRALAARSIITTGWRRSRGFRCRRCSYASPCSSRCAAGCRRMSGRSRGRRSRCSRWACSRKRPRRPRPIRSRCR